MRQTSGYREGAVAGVKRQVVYLKVPFFQSMFVSSRGGGAGSKCHFPKSQTEGANPRANRLRRAFLRGGLLTGFQHHSSLGRNRPGRRTVL